MEEMILEARLIRWLESWGNCPDTQEVMKTYPQADQATLLREINEEQLTELKEIFSATLNLQNFDHKLTSATNGGRKFQQFLRIALVHLTYEYASSLNVWDNLGQSLTFLQRGGRRQENWIKLQKKPFDTLFQKYLDKGIRIRHTNYCCHTLIRLAGIPRNFNLGHLERFTVDHILAFEQNTLDNNLNYDQFVYQFAIPRLRKLVEWMILYREFIQDLPHNSAEQWIRSCCEAINDGDFVAPWQPESGITGFPRNLSENHYMWKLIKKPEFYNSVMRRNRAQVLGLTNQRNETLKIELVEDQGQRSFQLSRQCFYNELVEKETKIKVLHLSETDAPKGTFIYRLVNQGQQFKYVLPGDCRLQNVAYGDRILIQNQDNQLSVDLSPIGKIYLLSSGCKPLALEKGENLIPSGTRWQTWCVNGHPEQTLLRDQQDWIRIDSECNGISFGEYEIRRGNSKFRLNSMRVKNAIQIEYCFSGNIPSFVGDLRITGLDTTKNHQVNQGLGLSKSGSEYILSCSDAYWGPGQLQISEDGESLEPREIFMAKPDLFWISSPEPDCYILHWKSTLSNLCANNLYENQFIHHPSEEFAGIHLRTELSKPIELKSGGDLFPLLLHEFRNQITNEFEPSCFLVSYLMANEHRAKTIDALLTDQSQIFPYKPENAKEFVKIRIKGLADQQYEGAVVPQLQKLCNKMESFPIHFFDAEIGWTFQGTRFARKIRVNAKDRIDQATHVKNLVEWQAVPDVVRMQMSAPNLRRPIQFLLRHSYPRRIMEEFLHDCKNSAQVQPDLELSLMNRSNFCEAIPKAEENYAMDTEDLFVKLNKWLENKFGDQTHKEWQLTNSDFAFERNLSATKILCSLLRGERLNGWRAEAFDVEQNRIYLQSFAKIWDKHKQLKLQVSQPQDDQISPKQDLFLETKR